MAVVSEIWQGRGGSVSEDGRRAFKRIFRVRFPEGTGGPLAAIRAVPVRKYDPYVDGDGKLRDRGCLCKSVEPRQVAEDPSWWEVTASYDSTLGRPDQQQQNPVDRAPTVSLASQENQVYSTHDMDGRGFVNSAGDPFDDGLPIDDTRFILTVTRNEATLPRKAIFGLQGKINDAPFAGFDAGTVKFANVRANTKYEDRITYWEITYEFHIRTEAIVDGQIVTWQHRELDRGRRELKDGKRVEITSAGANTPVSSPVLLNGKGAALIEGAQPVFIDPPFRVCRPGDFKVLHLDGLEQLL